MLETGHSKSFGYQLLSLDPRVDVLLENIKRDTTTAKYHIVKASDIKPFGQLTFGLCTEIAYLEFAHFVRKCLTWPANVSIDFRANVQQ